MSPHEKIQEIARKYNFTLSKVKFAVDKLGHYDGEKIARYLNERGWAIIRYKRDENGNKIRLTDDDISKKYM